MAFSLARRAGAARGVGALGGRVRSRARGRRPFLSMRRDVSRIRDVNAAQFSRPRGSGRLSLQPGAESSAGIVLNGPLRGGPVQVGFGFFLLNPRAVFTQATSSHAEARSPRFVRVRPASSRNPIPVDSRRSPSTRHWGGSARRGRASGAACVRGRVREETNRQESTGIDRSRVCPCGAKRTRATAQGRERVDSGAARREGPRA